MSASTIELRYERSYPVEPNVMFDWLLTRPLEVVFRQRYGPIAPIRSTSSDAAHWSSSGQSRTIEMTDGSTLRETLTAVEPPRRFGYHIDHVTGMMKPLIAEVDGEWSFTPAGTGVLVRWTWQVTPAGRAASLAMPVFRRLWTGMAARTFANLETDVLTELA